MLMVWWLGAVSLKNQTKVITESVTLPVLLQQSMIASTVSKTELNVSVKVYTVSYCSFYSYSLPLQNWISVTISSRQLDHFLHFSAIRGYLGGRKSQKDFLNTQVCFMVCLFFSKSDLWIPINSLIVILSIWLPLSLWEAKRSQGQLLEEPKFKGPSCHSFLRWYSWTASYHKCVWRKTAAEKEDTFFPVIFMKRRKKEYFCCCWGYL